ncbi:hypothetical protein H6P81_017723 [Aristolochia fimbriata]|uniref:Uncharacterized protein n=1 Tax=Aristolochia fimbriata TaxID=158543 RepID=A0AAV7E004_ARIFI|nr:hypothetical protein H6P81_017723 [Aristolochia fimbriata]
MPPLISHTETKESSSPWRQPPLLYTAGFCFTETSTKAKQGETSIMSTQRNSLASIPPIISLHPIQFPSPALSWNSNNDVGPPKVIHTSTHLHTYYKEPSLVLMADPSSLPLKTRFECGCCCSMRTREDDACLDMVIDGVLLWVISVVPHQLDSLNSP